MFSMKDFIFNFRLYVVINFITKTIFYISSSSQPSNFHKIERTMKEGGGEKNLRIGFNFLISLFKTIFFLIYYSNLFLSGKLNNYSIIFLS